MAIYQYNVDCTQGLTIRLRAMGSDPAGGANFIAKATYSDAIANPVEPAPAPEVSFTVTAAQLNNDVNVILQARAAAMSGTVSEKLAVLQGGTSCDGSVTKAGATPVPIVIDANGDAVTDSNLNIGDVTSHTIVFVCNGGH
jgi:hypothetical protein